MRPARLAAAILVLCLGMLYLLRGLPWEEHARLSYDSFRYLAGADSILKSGRYLDLDGRPQQVWPPGLSLLYAAVARVSGVDVLQLVKPVNVTSYILLTVSCVGIAAVTGMRIWIGTAMLAAIVLNGSLMGMHNKLWSEPPALAAIAATLLCLIAAWRDRKRAVPYFLAACAGASAGILLRYALLALVPLLIIIAMLIRRRALALIALATPLPAVAALSVLDAPRGNRGLAFEGLPWRENIAALHPLADQIFPLRLLGTLAVALFVIWCVVLPFVIAARAQDDDPRRTTLIGSIWSVGYGAFLLAAQAVSVPSFIIDLRILSPLYLGVIIAIAAMSEIAARRKLAVAALLAVPLVLAAARGARFATTNSFRGETAPPPCVARAAYVDAIRSAAPPDPLVSNAQGVVWLATRRPVAAIEAGGTSRRGTIIWIDPQRACPGTTEQNDVAPPPHPPTADGLVILRR